MSYQLTFFETKKGRMATENDRMLIGFKATSRKFISK